MIVWDRGQWNRKGSQKALQRASGVTLDGARLKGVGTGSIRPRSGEKTEPWLLIKSDDEFARQVGDWTSRGGDDLAAQRPHQRRARSRGEVRKDHAARARVVKARKAILPDIGKLSGARTGLLPFSLSRAWRHCAKSLRPARNGSMRSNTTATHAGTDRRAHHSSADAQEARLDRTLSQYCRRIQALGLASALIDGEIVVEDASGFRASTTCRPI